MYAKNDKKYTMTLKSTTQKYSMRSILIHDAIAKFNVVTYLF